MRAAKRLQNACVPDNFAPQHQRSVLHHASSQLKALANRQRTTPTSFKRSFHRNRNHTQASVPCVATAVQAPEAPAEATNATSARLWLHMRPLLPQGHEVAEGI